MNKKRKPLKKFKVYYFIGDYWSGKEETRRYRIIHARSESEAEQIFKKYYTYKNFGWVDEIRNSDGN